MNTGCLKQRLTAVLTAALTAALWAGTLAPAAAQNYPNKAIHMIIPAPVGGAVDSFARLVSQKLAIALGQPVIPENKAGAGTMIGSEYTAKAAPDGYTVLMITNSHAINAGLRKTMRYDSVNDFAPVILIGSIADLLLVHPSVPVKNVKEFVELGRKQQITYASAGVGSGTHLGGVLFNQAAKLNMLHVPFAGGPPALSDVVGGHINMMFSNTLIAMPLIKDGRLRALGLAAPKRSALLPTIPTIAEQGYPGFESGAWFGVLLPAKTPPQIVNLLNREIAKILQMPDVRENMTSKGLDIEFSTPEEFGAYLRKDIDAWKKLREANPGLTMGD
jgi:tripartite-type tricarboxylate transporter receptor subunit TctC